MEVTINILELASELADVKIREVYNNNNSVFPKGILVDNPDGDTTYTDEAQLHFDLWYDHYYDLIFNLKV
jgi:hypothetical protein